jgi:uncharacterized protein (DUF305 family)
MVRQLHPPERGNVRHSLRLAIVPVAVGALLLTACGSDDSSSTTNSTIATAGETTGDFNDADVIFAQGMIPHHQQAVEMAAFALAPEAAASPEIVALATEIQTAQDPEIVQMTAWLQGWGQPIDMPGMEGMEGMGSDEMEGMEGMENMGGMEGMMSAEDMANLQSLSGPDFDTAWATMMIAHHEGAIAQAQAVKSAGSNPDVLVLADEIIAAQQAEIDQMRALLGG